MSKRDDLLNTASWIYASTGADLETCLNKAADLLAALSEGDEMDEPIEPGLCCPFHNEGGCAMLPCHDPEAPRKVT